jgi:hemoglobin/transferrin/lactoferrin receptor protein
MHNTIRQLCAVVLLLCATAYVAFSQGEIGGTVVDKTTGLPISNVIVRSRSGRDTTSTDASGRFTLSLVSSDPVVLIFTHMSFQLHEQRRLPGLPCTVALEPRIFGTSEVVVQSLRTSGSTVDYPVPAIALPVDQLSTSSLRTVSDALQSEPGVALVRDGMWETAVSIRGLTRSNVVMMVDNVRIETANDIAGALSMINTYDLDRVEVVKGGNSVLFGTGALGGAVNCVSARPEFGATPHVAGKAGVSYEGVNTGKAAFGAIDASSDVWRLHVAGAKRDAENYRSPVGTVSSSQYHDFGLTLAAGVKTINEQSLDVVYERSQAENTGIPGVSAFDATATARFTLSRRELGKVEYVIPKGFGLLENTTIRASRQVIQRNVEVLQQPKPTLTPHATHTTNGVQVETGVLVHPAHSFVVGIEGWERALESRRERKNLANRSIVGESPLPDSKYGSAGLYVQDDWKIVPEMTRLLLGVRFDLVRSCNDKMYNVDYTIDSAGAKAIPSTRKVVWDATKKNTKSWAANAGIHQSIGAGFGASVLVASAYRAPSLEELYQYINNGGVVRAGNPNLKPEESVSANVALEYKKGPIGAAADVYVNALTNLIAEIPGTFNGQSALVKDNIGKAVISGYELRTDLMVGSQTALHGSVAYVRGRDTRNHANLTQIAPLKVRASWDQIVAGYGTGSVSVEGYARQNNPGAGEGRTAGYVIVGLEFSSERLALGPSNWQVRLGVDNLFDQAYINHLATTRGINKYEPGRNVHLRLEVNI